MDMWMNGFEFPWWAVSVLLTGSLAIYAWIRLRILEVRLTSLDEQLGVYTQASIEVARTLQTSLEQRTRIAEVELDSPVELPQRSCTVSSRRYLLQEAQSDLSRGEKIEEVRRRFALHQDELFLLRRMAGADSVRQLSGRSI